MRNTLSQSNEDGRIEYKTQSHKRFISNYKKAETSLKIKYMDFAN